MRCVTEVQNGIPMRAHSIAEWPKRGLALASVLVLVALIATLDWRSAAHMPLGFLYLLPMAIAGSCLNPLEIASAAIACTILTERFDDFPWHASFGVPRDILYIAAFAGAGFLMYEVARRRNLTAAHLLQLQSEISGRRDAEEQLETLVGSSPAAILTADGNGRILLANDAAHRLLGVGSGHLRGLSIRGFVPSLVNVPEASRQPFRTSMQCQGRRADGEAFHADLWFSTYQTSAGPRLAIMMADTSEELRTREEASFHHLFTGSRILLSAVTHEIRNVCGAIAMVHEKLARSGRLAGNKDFETLGTLVLALERIAAKDSRQSNGPAADIDVGRLLDELRIVVEAALREEGIELEWRIEDDLPSVWANRQSLMQVFLNLVKNSERAMRDRAEKHFLVDAHSDQTQVLIRFTDTGGGVAHPELLFRPFQEGAQSTGLGLYLSRAFMRGFGGDLRYESSPAGSTFIVVLAPARERDLEDGGAGSNQSVVGRRSQLVSREPEPVARDGA